MTKWVALVLLGAAAVLGGCTTMRPLGGVESCCDGPDECEWVVVNPSNSGDEMLFLCCKSPDRETPRCKQVMWSQVTE